VGFYRTDADWLMDGGAHGMLDVATIVFDLWQNGVAQAKYQ